MKNKRYFTPTEVEREMQKAREKADFVKTAETTGVRCLLDNATKINGRTFLIINPMYVHIPAWQRDMDIKSALKIGAEFNPNKWDLPKVICSNGKLLTGDGEHRIYGAFKAGIPQITVEYLDGVDEMEAIRLFTAQSEDRRNMRPVDKYRAFLHMEDPTTLKLKEICNKNNINVLKDKAIENPLGTLTSISDGMTLVKTNPKLLDKILKLINSLQWFGCKAYGAKVIRGLKRMYSYYGVAEMEMENILIRNCKGAEYFMKNLNNKDYCSFYDYLIDVVEREIHNGDNVFQLKVN